MQILVIDRDALTTQLLQARLEARGHTLVAEPNKNEAFERLKQGGFDCVMIDPAPMSDARPVIIGVWKALRGPYKPYVMLLSKTASREDAIMAGTNDVLTKPFDPKDLETKMGNAERLIALHRHLGTEDSIHSGGGMIGKSAFNQLFLSAIDRAFRYGERSLVILVKVANTQALRERGDMEVAQTLASLGERLTYSRRQSDVIGRVAVDQFGILLQRPLYESEPFDAINRFAETLDKFHHEFADKAQAPHIELELIELPEGVLLATRHAPLADGIVHGDVAQTATADGSPTPTTS